MELLEWRRCEAESCKRCGKWWNDSEKRWATPEETAVLDAAESEDDS